VDPKLRTCVFDVGIKTGERVLNPDEFSFNSGFSLISFYKNMHPLVKSEDL